MRSGGGFGRSRPWLLLAGVLAALLIAAMLAVHVGPPPKVAPESVTWTVTSMFQKDAKGDPLRDQPRMNLSGAACAPTAPRFTSCLIANDEKTYAQFFSIDLDRNLISPGKLIRLSDADDDPDAEGVAYAGGYFYVAGSHGRSRSNKPKDSSYAVFRLPVDPATGAPPFEVSEDKVAAGIEVSLRLRGPLSTSALIKDYYNKPLDQGGMNTEGIAVQGEWMYLGLRGPSVDGRAFVLRVDARAAFTPDSDLRAEVRPLRLGRDTGIRDLAAVDGGILVLAGPTREEAVPYSVWLWDGVSDTPKPLGTLDLDAIDKNAKAEILLLLAEEASQFRVLVMFDGIENGRPLSFRLQR
jgi:hypothetical protein